MNKQKNLGQFFTPNKLVDLAISLMGHTTSILEPSAGTGQFFNKLPENETLGVEIDETLTLNTKILCKDFFLLPQSLKFNCIIGNPPFVSYKNITEVQKTRLKYDVLNKRANLFSHFVLKSFNHLKNGGEMIFIAPKEFLFNSSNYPLIDILLEKGYFSDIFDFGDNAVFENVTQNIILFKYIKSGKATKIWEANYNGNKIKCINNAGYIQFDINDTSVPLKNLFSVKVGGVSGADDIYEDEKCGNIEIVYSKTKKTGNTKKVLYGNDIIEHLLPNKNKLLNRKIKRFNENNWWEWGRKITSDLSPKIYVNAKTRDPQPFFTHKCPYFDGSIIALIPHNPNINLQHYIKILNSQNWNKTGGRLQFTQSQLENFLIKL